MATLLVIARSLNEHKQKSLKTRMTIPVRRKVGIQQGFAEWKTQGILAPCLLHGKSASSFHTGNTFYKYYMRNAASSEFISSWQQCVIAGPCWVKNAADSGTMFASWPVCIKFSHREHLLWVLHAKRNLLRVYFELATMHYSRAMHGIAPLRILSRWHDVMKKLFMRLYYKSRLTVTWLDAKWQMQQLWWWKSDRGWVAQSHWLQSLLRGRST